ncbi:MAG: topoisomerase [Gaiellaceae bacterium]|jgi:DNA topoisomerase-1|nr:topoisomerase [Gaiellaceae bacterium]
MPRRGGLRREGSRGRFRYVDARGKRVTDADKLERIKSLVIPPAWKEVWIASSASAKLQATGVDAAGRKQYLYHPNFRAQREQEKFDRLIRFAERLPELREAMSEDMDNEILDRARVSAIATRLINRAWFRVGTEKYAKESKTFGITTLRKKHVTVRGQRIAFDFQGKHKSVIRTALVDAELAEAIKELLAQPKGTRLFRYEWDGGLCALTGAKLNEYVRQHLGDEFTAKDFRTWGGTLIAAVALAERGPAETETKAKRNIAAVMRRVGAELGNTPAVARGSYVSPAVIDQYLDGTTIEDFRPRHLRVVGARDLGLDREEQALLSLLRSWRIKQARAAA